MFFLVLCILFHFKNYTKTASPPQILKTPPSMLRAKVPRMDPLKKHRRRLNCTDGSVLFNTSLVELQVSEAFHSTQTQTQANVQLDHTPSRGQSIFVLLFPKDKTNYTSFPSSIQKSCIEKSLQTSTRNFLQREGQRPRCP